jgi:hypothetical protein
MYVLEYEILVQYIIRTQCLERSCVVQNIFCWPFHLSLAHDALDKGLFLTAVLVLDIHFLLSH